MADDSIHIPDETPCHPCDTPRGLMYYDLDILTCEQQQKLNVLKRTIIKEDETYLAQHPEIRAIVSIIIRDIFRQRPRTNLHDHIACLFAKPKEELQRQIDEYCKTREGHLYEGNSAVGLCHEYLYKKEVSEKDVHFMEPEEEEEEEEEEDWATILPKKAMNDILEKVFRQLGLVEMSIADLTEWQESTRLIVRESMFEAFMATSSLKLDVKQKVIGDLLQAEILNRMDEFVAKVVEKYEGKVPMTRDEVLYERREDVPEAIDEGAKIGIFESLHLDAEGKPIPKEYRTLSEEDRERDGFPETELGYYDFESDDETTQETKDKVLSKESGNEELRLDLNELPVCLPGEGEGLSSGLLDDKQSGSRGNKEELTEGGTTLLDKEDKLKETVEGDVDEVFVMDEKGELKENEEEVAEDVK